ALCEVQATVRPTPDSAIEILVWLPTDWNGKFQQLGNNGFAGVFKYPEMAENVRRQYAVASTTTGHRGAFDPAWAIGHPEKVTDFLWRGTRHTTLKAKALVNAFYGKPPRYSYWNGCSNGGAEGLMQAQRYPGEFDGIIAGGAFANWSRAVAQELVISKLLSQARIADTQLRAVTKAVVQACDANDGVKGDGLIGDPRRCNWKPQEIVCKPGQDAAQCLTPSQADAVAAAYEPVRDPVSGQVLFPGSTRGAEWEWERLLYNKELQSFALNNVQMAYQDAGWNGSTFNLSVDVPRLDQFFAARNAIDPDLSAFHERGGKLIQYMGWEDATTVPGWTVQYYDMVEDALARGETPISIQSFYRLYMMPGVGHCGRGQGPTLTRFDLVTAMENWVERGVAPQAINATNAANAAPVKTLTLERPICPYPQEAVYDGKGDITQAGSFQCQVASARIREHAVEVESAGGCSAGNWRFDPMLAGLVGLAGIGLLRRRRSRKAD
ncbi:MAG TPA: DUF6351 family protein, partial [Ramlibacter sp.]|nr:DUF6351 family protein [Ramlibacter sp.]